MVLARVRAYPDPTQEAALRCTFDGLAVARDLVIGAHRDALRRSVDPLGGDALVTYVATERRRLDPVLQQAAAVAVQQMVRHADAECRAARFGKGHWPKPGGEVRWMRLVGSSTTAPVGEGRYARVQVAKVGRIRVRQTVRVPSGATSMTMSLDAAGRWHIAWHGEPVMRPVPSPAPRWLLGLDLGVSHLAHVVAWDPATGETDRWILDRNPATDHRQEIEALTAVVARRTSGSAGHARAQARLDAALHAASDARRLDERRIAAALLDSAVLVGVEALDGRGMRSTGKVQASALSRAGMNSFVRTLVQSSLTRPWVSVVLVDPRHTTTTCCLCGCRRDPIPLSERTWECMRCAAAVLDRDWNAAVNVLARAMRASGWGPGPGLHTRGRLATVAGSG